MNISSSSSQWIAVSARSALMPDLHLTDSREAWQRLFKAVWRLVLCKVESLKKHAMGTDLLQEMVQTAAPEPAADSQRHIHRSHKSRLSLSREQP